MTTNNTIYAELARFESKVELLQARIDELESAIQNFLTWDDRNLPLGVGYMEAWRGLEKALANPPEKSTPLATTLANSESVQKP